MINRVRIKNFKSLKDIDLALGPLNVLVGPNMGGKSNILDALFFLQQFLAPQPGVDGLIYALSQRGGVNEVLWKGGGESLIVFNVEATTLGGKEWVYELEVVAGASGFAQIQKESLRLKIGDTPKDLIVLDGNTRWLANQKGEKIVSYSSPSKSAMENAPDNWPGFEFSVALRLWKFYQFIPQAMKQANPTSNGLVLERIGQNISAWLMTIQTRFPDRFAKISEVALDVFPEITKLLTFPTAQGTVFLSSNERGLKQAIGVGQMSDGELAFLALLSLIYCPPELGATVYLIEEPETHLHPHLISTLIRLLRQHRAELTAAGEPLAQVITTTQSPLLVDEAALEEVIWVGKKDGQTRVLRPDSKRHLHKLVADKELGLGDIVYSGMLSEPQ
jgi:predicted ATPase